MDVRPAAGAPVALRWLEGEVDRGEGADLAAVIKESMRRRPVIPNVMRRLTAPLDLGGHRVPAGAYVSPCLYLTHHLPSLYPEPSRFRPERFLEGQPEPYGFVPFGGGVRRCLGAPLAALELEVVLREVVSRVRLAPAAAPQRVLRRVVTFTPKDGTPVVVFERRGLGHLGQERHDRP